jgi:transposase
MAGLLIEARDAAAAARLAGQATLDPAILDDLLRRYRALAAAGLPRTCTGAPPPRKTPAASPASRRSRTSSSASPPPDLDIFTNNEAERTIRPVKVAQRGSGGAWRTLQGLADFAIVESYLSTAAKWGITKLDALRGLFSGHPWKPCGLQPAGWLISARSRPAVRVWPHGRRARYAGTGTRRPPLRSRHRRLDRPWRPETSSHDLAQLPGRPATP